MTIGTYTLIRTADGYRIRPPGALTWNEIAPSLAIARKWIAQHKAERRERARAFAAVRPGGAR